MAHVPLPTIIFYFYFVCSARSRSWHRQFIFFACVLLFWYLMFKRWLFKTQFLCFFRLVNERIAFMNIKIVKNFNICRFINLWIENNLLSFDDTKGKEFYFFSDLMSVNFAILCKEIWHSLTNHIAFLITLCYDLHVYPDNEHEKKLKCTFVDIFKIK